MRQESARGGRKRNTKRNYEEQSGNLERITTFWQNKDRLKREEKMQNNHVKLRRFSHFCSHSKPRPKNEIKPSQNYMSGSFHSVHKYFPQELQSLVCVCVVVVVFVCLLCLVCGVRCVYDVIVMCCKFEMG